MKKFLFLSFAAMAMLLCMTACGNDDDPDIDSSEIYGTWVCTDAKVIDIDMNGIDLPSSAKDVITDAIEKDMIGQVITLTKDNAKLKGDYIVFNSDGVRWQVKSLDSRKMRVIYETHNKAMSYNLTVKVDCVYKKS